MDTPQFWDLIERTSHASAGDPEAHAERLTEVLAALPPSEIVAFQALLDSYLYRAMTPALWDAAYLMNGGCSEDGFEYFRAWLIGQGRAVYEEALADPQSLVEVVGAEEAEAYESELLIYDALKAYEQQTGSEMPLTGSLARALEAHWSNGLRPEQYEEELVRRYPRLAERFW